MYKKQKTLILYHQGFLLIGCMWLILIAFTFLDANN